VEGAGAGEVYVSIRLNNVVDAAFSEMKNLRDEYLSSEHLLLAIADEKNGISARILKGKGASKDALMKALKEVRGSSASQTRILRQNTKLSKNTAATSQNLLPAENSTR